MSHALRVAWFRYRARFHRRWAGYLTMAILIGSVGGVALASLAGARRTDSSLPTYVASTNPSTLALFATYDDPGLGVYTGYEPALDARIARLPLVIRSSNGIIFDGNISEKGLKGIHLHLLAGETPPTIIGSTDGEFSRSDKVTLVSGRLANPHRRDEAVVELSGRERTGPAHRLGHSNSVLHRQSKSWLGTRCAVLGSTHTDCRGSSPGLQRR